MKKLFKNELIFFFTRRNIFISVIFLFGTIFIYENVYVKEYKSYYLENQGLINEYIQPVKAVINEFIESLSKNSNLINEKRGKLPTLSDSRRKKEEEQIAKLVLKNKKVEDELKHWKKIKSNGEFLINFYKNPSSNLYNISSTWKEIDDYLDYIYREKVPLSSGGIFLGGGREWTSRKILREANEAYLNTMNFNEKYPSAIRTLYNFTAGESWYFIVLVIAFIAMLNYDIWSGEFEYNDGKLINTIPYSCENIYLVRIFSRLVFTLSLVILAILVTSFYAGIRFGIGPDLSVVINSNPLKTAYKIVIDNSNIWKTDIPIKMSKFLLYGFAMFFIYSIFVFSIINFMSIMLKSSSLTIMLSTIGIGFIVFTKYLTVKNPFAFYRVRDILINGTNIRYDMSAPTNMGYMYYILVLSAILIVLNVISGIFFIRSRK